ncbi:glycosyl transferase [Lachnospiraceae bacterium AM25-17]|nr:glycosyl transferase [Lachnospiraceae bacterium AM25-17]RJU67988.1 glycosyl transferase [Coprococcus sp. AM27-12LB]
MTTKYKKEIKKFINTLERRKVMIPKVIHYCWFGGNELPSSAKKCIESWKKFFPDYEIKEWNEKNYDVRKNIYISQAYDAGKYAFVSDYARFDILYYHGGIYFDTDVEVIKNFDDILNQGAFMGCEIDGEMNSKFDKYVNPGLGIAAEAGLALYEEILDFYNKQRFLNQDGSLNMETVVVKTTQILQKYGLKNGNEIQKIKDINIYPKEYFNPKDSSTGKIEITQNTHSIHWYSMTWLSKKQKLRKKILDPFHRVFGADCFRCLKKILRLNE